MSLEQRPVPQLSPVRLRSLLGEGPFWLLAAIGVLFHLSVILRLETFFYRDLWVYVLPQGRLLGASILAGQWPPTWNPFLFGGKPFAADMSTTTFYPASIVWALLSPSAAL